MTLRPDVFVQDQPGCLVTDHLIILVISMVSFVRDRPDGLINFSMVT